MSNFTDSAQSKQIDQREHNNDASAKRVVQYYQDGGGDWVQSPGNTTYGISAISDDGTYKYFFFEDNDLNYYILRKHIANKVFTYTAGTGGYSAVYVDSTHGPSGSPTWGTKGSTF